MAACGDGVAQRLGYPYPYPYPYSYPKPKNKPKPSLSLSPTLAPSLSLTGGDGVAQRGDGARVGRLRLQGDTGEIQGDIGRLSLTLNP